MPYKNKKKNKINIYIKHKKQIIINYLTKIASNILKIKNSNDIIILHKSKNIYEIFKNHDNYLTVKIYIIYDNEFYKTTFYIKYNNMDYIYKYDDCITTEIKKNLENINILFFVSSIHEKIHEKCELYNINKRYIIRKQNNHIIFKSYKRYHNFDTFGFRLFYFYYKKYKGFLKIYSLNFYDVFKIYYYEYNYKIYIKQTESYKDKKKQHFIYKNNYLSLNYLLLFN